MIKYANISDNEYTQICRGKKSTEKKRSEIIALSNKENSDILLFVSKNETFDLVPIFSDEQIKINGIPIERIIKNSSLQYLREMFDDTDYFENIFVNNHKYVFLQNCYLSEERWTPYMFFEDSEQREFFFYNKGIFISDFRGVLCRVPYSLDAIGYVNYIGQKIKLDVSRKNIIAGYSSLQKELSIILLKFLRKKFNNNYDLISMINAMIEFCQTE